jgi:hypothetical protein
MKPLYMTRAEVKEELDYEIVSEGSEIAFFITRDTPIIITPYEPRGLRRLVGEACLVNTPATQHAVLVCGDVGWVANEIRDHFEEKD